MGKSSAVKAKSKASDPLTKVKNGGVTKPADSPKVKSKQLAKDVATKAVNGKEKKTKKPVKPVEPESESEEEDSDSSASSDDDSEDDSSDSSEASAEDSDASDSSEDEKPAKKKAVNGAAKKTAAAAESESDSDSSDSDSEEETKPKTNGAAKVNGAAKANGVAKKEESDSDSDSSEDSDSESEAEDEKPATKAKAAKEDSDSDSDSDSSDSSDSDSEEQTPETKAEEPTKKRKALDDPVIPPKKARTEDTSEQSSTLFVGSLAWAVTDDILYGAFAEFPDLVSARVITDKEGGRSRGFGYVDFANASAAAAALEGSQGKELEGRAMNIDFSGARPARSDNPRERADNRAQRHGDQVSPESDTLFVGNISFEMDQDTVRDFFSTAGEVTGVRLPTDPESGNLKGFGYVTFSSIEQAKAAFNQLNGEYLGEGSSARAVRLDYAGARPPRDGGGRGGFGGRGGGRGGGGRGGGGRGGFGGRGGGGRGGGRGGFSSTNRSGLGEFKGTKISF